MGARHINPVDVVVSHIDRNDDHPGMLWLVSLLSQPNAGFGTTAAACEDKDDAVRIGETLAHANGWSLQVRPARKTLA